MADDGQFLDAAGLTVQPVGGLRETGDPWMPFELVDADGGVVAPVAAYLKDVQACGRSEATLRSYGMDLLRWFRFCWASGLEWDQVTRSEAADFCRWLTVAGKPGSAGGYAPATAAHCETVLRHFYGFHLEAGTGPDGEPVPAGPGPGPAPGRTIIRWTRSPVAGPGCSVPGFCSGPRGCIPDGQFGELFARLGSHRDRALVAFWVSTGARASELLGATAGDVDPGRQLITVIRKGTRAMQQLPASPDAFVWLRLYQEQMRGLVPGRAGPAAVVDAAAPVPAADVSRGAAHVHARRGIAGNGLDAARPAAYRRLSHGPGSGDAAGRYPVDTRPCASEHNTALPGPGARRRDRLGHRVPRPPGPAGTAGPGAWPATGRTRLQVLFGTAL